VLQCRDRLKLGKNLNCIKLGYCYNWVSVVRYPVGVVVALLSVFVGACVGCTCESGWSVVWCDRLMLQHGHGLFLHL
jgi:hypothetical protein